ncbi:hypothetical protein FA15DRAFT_658427 [Coprinopsis marcescibilis]|uniref:Uncharacterized protein n=1 Tax=Coprinopsis marcescibilis TaxID=230819 RepID=A0A5C3KLZ4_COPMA|nr:hypothetical protein FA15DRAFT_658427 [Coprinopsis marcescibilis]
MAFKRLCGLLVSRLGSLATCNYASTPAEVGVESSTDSHNKAFITSLPRTHLRLLPTMRLVPDPFTVLSTSIGVAMLSFAVVRAQDLPSLVDRETEVDRGINCDQYYDNDLDIRQLSSTKR